MIQLKKKVAYMIERGKTMPIEIALRNYIGDVRTSTIERTRRDSGNCNLDNWMLYKYSRREEPTNDNSPILIADSLWSPRESQNNEDVISSSQLMTSLSGKTWQPSVTAYHANPFMVSRIEHFFILLFFHVSQLLTSVTIHCRFLGRIRR